MRSLVLVTGPTSEAISASEAKAWARLDGSDDDALIEQLIGAATHSAQEYLRRSLISQTWKLTLDLGGSDLDRMLGDGTYDLPVTALYGGLPQIIPLPKGPVSSITSVVTYDLDNTSSTFASSSYRVDNSGDRLVLNYGAIWPSNLRPQSACEVTYVAGYGAASSVPQPIKTGLMIHVATLYEQRGQCDDPTAVPASAKQLYNQYRIIGSRCA
jgi:hypothetical protein